ncbi:MAG: hypothetical protein ACRD0N_06265, partial [Acidimicrobiales bacterium]
MATVPRKVSMSTEDVLAQLVRGVAEARAPKAPGGRRGGPGRGGPGTPGRPPGAGGPRGGPE